MDTAADKLLWGVKNGDLDTVKQCIEKVRPLLRMHEHMSQHNAHSADQLGLLADVL